MLKNLNLPADGCCLLESVKQKNYKQFKRKEKSTNGFASRYETFLQLICDGFWTKTNPVSTSVALILTGSYMMATLALNGLILQKR